jgi:hypothetical protein
LTRWNQWLHRSANRIYCLALLLEAAVFHRQVLFLKGFLFPWDFRTVHWPLAAFVADSFRQGVWPLWDPYTYCGNPIYANIQTALFYPPMLAATLVGSWMGVGALPRLLAISAVAQIFFAGACTFFLLRRLGTGAAPAWIAGTVYELGCFFAVHAEHLGAIQGAAWMPLAWLAVVELREGWRWRWLAALTLALAMSVLAGLPQVAVAVFGSALLVAIVLAAFGLAGRLLPLHVLLAWIWALALAAVQIVPTIELTRQSVAKYRVEWLKSGGGIRPGAFFTLLSPNHWHAFDPARFNGPGELTFTYLYSSILGLALAAAAVIWKPARVTRAFSVAALAATFCMLGDSTLPGRAMLEALPVSIRIGIHPEYWLSVFALALAVLAGLGAERCLPGSRLQVLAGIAIVCDLVLVSSGRPFNVSSLAAEPGITRGAVDGSEELAAKLRALTGAAYPPYRFDMTAGVPYNWSSTAPLLAIPTANGCDPLALERIIQVRLSFAPGARWGTCYQVVDSTSPVLPLTNARYLLAVTPVEAGDLRLAEEIHGYRIYENPAVLPRSFLVDRAVRAQSLAEAAAWLHAADFRPAEWAIVEGPVDGIEPAGGAPESVEVVSYQPTRLELRTHAAGAALLVVADSYYPGWEARVDGRPAPLYAADVGFRGVPVSAGDHRVEMRFVPRILIRSAMLSLVALVALAVSARRRLLPPAGTG